MSNSNFCSYDNVVPLFSKAGTELGKRAKIFPGTRAEWDLLTVQEKVQYDYTAFDDDYQTAEVDSVPTENSTHLVASGGVYDALEEKVDTSALAAVATTGEYSDIDNTPTLGTASGKNSTSVIASGSTDLIESGSVYSALSNKADTATTLAGYNITNAYTKDEIQELFAEHENNISWKPAVATYADIATTYPNPQEGWTVCCTDTNIVWRYYNGQWVQISANTIPLASASVDGLMSMNMFSKLNGIASGAEVNVQSNWTQTNTSADDYIKNKPGDATTSASGFMSASDKTKLNGIAMGAEVNQNAFSNVVVGSTTISADGKTDTLTLAAGSNVTLTPDANSDKVTIAATNSTYPKAVKGITRNGTTFTATCYDGTTFTFTQQDNNTTTGTTYNAGSCPDNTTFGTNGSIKRVYDAIKDTAQWYGTTDGSISKRISVNSATVKNYANADIQAKLCRGLVQVTFAGLNIQCPNAWTDYLICTGLPTGLFGQSSYFVAEAQGTNKAYSCFVTVDGKMYLRTDNTGEASDDWIRGGVMYFSA